MRTAPTGRTHGRTDQAQQNIKITLAKGEPSTHGAWRTLHLPPGAVLHGETTLNFADRLHLHLEGPAEASDLRFGVAALLGFDPRQPCASVKFAINQWIDQHMVMVVMPEASIGVDHPMFGAFNGLRYAWSQLFEAEANDVTPVSHPAITRVLW